MSLNWKEIDAVLNELNLTGAFIQQIVQPGYDSIALYTYKTGTPKTILICLAGGACRIHETKRSVPKADKPLRFMEFLKSRIKGARIEQVQQLGRERIIKMDLSHCGEKFFLYIRLWSGAANILLTDTGNVILDSFYRRPAKGEITGGTFTLPEEIQQSTQNHQNKTAVINPILEKEYNNTQKHCDQYNASSEKTDDLPQTDDTRIIRTFDTLPDAAHLTLNEKIDQWYGEHSGQLSREALLEQASKFYTSRHSRMESALHRLEQKRQDFMHAERWKHYGDMILAYGHLVDGSASYIECEDYETGNTIRIQINPEKRAQENATMYYTKYKKAVSGLSELEYDIQKARRELLDLEAVYQTICREPNPIKMQQMIRRQTKPRQQLEKKRPGLTYEIDGWTLFAGRTASENDELLRRHVKGQDMWLHTRDYAGGYVFIKSRAGKTVPLDILLLAGNLAVYHSKARKSGQADLYYTQVKYLRRAKNGPKGLVLPSQEKNLFIKLDRDKLKILDSHLIQ